MRRPLVALAVTASLAVATPAFAQDEGDAAAYLALITSPPGALPPMLTPGMTGAERKGPAFGARYGYVDLFGISLHGLAATADIPVGTRGSNIGLAAGYQFVTCDPGEDCSGHVMLGGSFDTRLARSTGTTPINVGLSTAVGAAFPEDVRAFSASVGVPIVLEAASGGARVAPFITPGLGWGYANIDDVFAGSQSESGFRFMLGGGVTVATAGGRNFGLGVQKVFIDGGDVQFGLGFSFGGPRKS